jgi:RHS repeat-associated protein
LEHKGYNNVVISEYNYQTYVGKELNENLGYDMLEMDWRHYDPSIGRFVTIDAMADTFPTQTPYHYGNNGPLFFKDPTGLFSTVVNDEGVVTDHIADEDYNIYLNSRESGDVLGQENPNKSYKKGDKLFNVVKNDDSSVFSLALDFAASLGEEFTDATAVTVLKTPAGASVPLVIYTIRVKNDNRKKES